MSSSTAMPRLAGWIHLRASVLALMLVPLLAAASTSLRHLALERSEPASGSRVTAPLRRISLWFTAKPEVVFSRIRLIGASSAISLDTIIADRENSLHAAILRAVEPGDYRVEWQTASADGHPIRGDFTFTLLASGPLPPSMTGRSSDTAAAPLPIRSITRSRRDDSGFRTARWLEFAAILTILGALGFRHGVLPPLAARGIPTSDAADRARRLGQSMLAAYVLAVLVRLVAQSRALNGAEAVLDARALAALVTSTTWGVGWSVGVVGAAFLLAGWVVSKRNVTIGTPLALTGALAMVLSPALSGHAATDPRFIVSVTIDMLHVTAAGVWVGGLAMVLFAGVPAMLRLAEGNKHAAVSALVNSFHPLALFCAPIAIVSGLGTSWIRLGGIGALLTTEYGRTLVLKVAVVALLAGMGAYNAVRGRRQLIAAAGDGGGTRRFRVTGSLELVFGAIVIIITTFLVVTPAPSEMGAP